LPILPPIAIPGSVTSAKNAAQVELLLMKIMQLRLKWQKGFGGSMVAPVAAHV